MRTTHVTRSRRWVASALALSLSGYAQQPLHALQGRTAELPVPSVSAPQIDASRCYEIGAARDASGLAPHVEFYDPDLGIVFFHHREQQIACTFATLNGNAWPIRAFDTSSTSEADAFRNQLRDAIGRHDVPAQRTDAMVGCDELAGNPQLLRNVDAFSAPKAFQACRAAAASGPNRGRYLFQAARSLAGTFFAGLSSTEFVEAANTGYPPALAALGLRIQADGGKSAVDWFQRAADAGNPTGMLWLGTALLAGRVVPRDDARGMALLQQSAEAAHPAAMALLGSILLDPKYGRVDQRAGLAWLQIAANVRSPEGLERMGDVRLRGEGLPADASAAAQLYRQAIEAGSEPALLKLARLHESGTGAQRSAAAARKLYEQAGKSRDPEVAKAASSRLAGLNSESSLSGGELLALAAGFAVLLAILSPSDSQSNTAKPSNPAELPKEFRGGCGLAGCGASRELFGLVFP